MERFGTSPVRDSYWEIDGSKITPEMIRRMERCPCKICKKEAREMEDAMLRYFFISTASHVQASVKDDEPT